MKQSIRLEDIARQAGVSASTVSRVLNGSKRVADDKRALVLEAIAQHQYRPNPLAQGLVHGRTMMIGVLAQDIASPFFAKMVSGIEQGLAPTGYRPLLALTHWQTQDLADEAASLDQLLDRRIDGLIVLGGHVPDARLIEVAATLPTIVAARCVPGLEQQCLCVDNEEGAYRATRYLIGLRHRRIGHIAGTAGHPYAADRHAGYRRALVEAGLEHDPRLTVAGRFTEESGLAGVEELLGRAVRFTAIFAANDQSAYGAMLGLFNHGYRVPSDVSLVGFDDQFLSAYTLPPLTTIHHPTVELGRAAAEALLRLLDGQEPRVRRFPAQLVIRQSAMRAAPSDAR